MIAALDDDEHVDEQHARYAARRAALRDGAGVGAASGSTTPRRRSTSGRRRGRGLLGHRRLAGRARASSSRPASSTAPPGAEHVRVAFTATDERVAAAVARLTA